MKKSYYCKRLNETIDFDAQKIFFCCATRTGPSINAKENVSSVKKIITAREHIIKQLDRGEVPIECVGCYDLVEQQKSKYSGLNFYKRIPKPNTIIVKHFKQCNSSCIYCAEQYISKRKIVLKPQKSDYYDLLPIIKMLYTKNLIDKKNLTVLFQGGDISVLEEFEDLVNVFVDNSVKKIEIATNGIIYLPIIEKICKKTFVDMDISIDCGCRESYKKIKTVDKFDDLVKNLKRYSKLPIQLRLKYILVRNCNDNIEEVSKYIELMKEIGIKISELTIDQCDPEFLEKKIFKIPPHYYELYDFWEKKCKDYNIYPSLWSYLKEILEKGEFFA